LTLAGFQIVTFLPGSAADSRVYTVPFRLGVAILTLAILLTAAAKYGFRFHLSPAVLAVGVFWILYSGRLFLNLGVGTEVTSLKASDLVQYAYGICLLGFLALVMVREADIYEPWALRLTILALLLASLLSIRYILTNRLKTVVGGTVYGNQILNHITLGHTGASLVVLGGYLMLRRRGSSWARWGGAALIAVGLVVVVLSVSRGAVVALLVVMMPLLWFGWRSGRRTAVTIILLLGAVVGVVAVVSLTSWGLRIEDAFAKVNLLHGSSTTVREALITRSLREFEDHPLYGCCINVPGYHLYPHNIVVESFLATGFLGGVPLVTAILIACWRAIGLVRNRSELAWIGLLFLQYLIGALASGSLYSSYVFWSLLGIVIGVDLQDARPGPSVAARSPANAPTPQEAR
jgi:O-antigen ligase